MTEYADPVAQEAYTAEMQRLETGETVAPEGTPDPPIISDDDPVKTELAELKAKTERQEKALKDTQRAFHASQQKLSKLAKEHEAQTLAANKPAMLDANPGLEEAIRHVAQVTPDMTPKQADEYWIEAVTAAVPDAEVLLADKEFEAAVAKRRDELSPEEWRNPFTAIRELTTLKTTYTTRKAVEAAVAKAKDDYAKQQKELNAMRVPGGSGKAAERAPDKGAAAVWAMSEADFQKERQKVLGGYSL